MEQPQKPALIDDLYDIVFLGGLQRALTFSNLRRRLLDILDFADSYSPLDTKCRTEINIKDKVFENINSSQASVEFGLTKSYIFICIGQCILNQLGDRESATGAFRKAEENAATIEDLDLLAEAVLESLEDAAWHKRLRAEVQKRISTFSDFLCTLSFPFLYGN